MPGSSIFMDLRSLVSSNCISPSPLWRAQRPMMAALSSASQRLIGLTSGSEDHYSVFCVPHRIASRWTDGSFPAWYGGDSVETALHEVLYHAIRIRSAQGGTSELTDWREKRTILTSSCDAVLIDVTQKVGIYPWLVSDDYSKCQELGSFVKSKELHGICYQSARCDGVCAAIFSRAVLHTPDEQFTTTLTCNGVLAEAYDEAGRLLISRPVIV